MHTVQNRPGLIVVDATLGLIAYNPEALRILTFPDHPERIHHLDSWLTNKIRSELVGRNSPPHFVDEYRSAKRTYFCRSFPVDVKAHNGNGPGPLGGQILMLERRSNETVKICEVVQRFGLTAREQETVQYLLEGLTSKEIAQRMNISPNTVKAFIRLVMVKMSVSTRSGIIGRIVGPRP